MFAAANTVAHSALPVARLRSKVVSVGGSWKGVVASEVNVLRSIEFIHQGRRYRGRVAPVPGGGPEFRDGAWFVSMNGGPERRVFEAHRDDEDTPEFQHRIVIATWLTEGYNRRISGDRRKGEQRDPSAVDRRDGSDRRALPDLG